MNLDQAVIKSRHIKAEAELTRDRALATKLNSRGIYTICFECHGDIDKRKDNTFICLKCGVRFDERGEKI